MNDFSFSFHIRLILPRFDFLDSYVGCLPMLHSLHRSICKTFHFTFQKSHRFMVICIELHRIALHCLQNSSWICIGSTHKTIIKKIMSLNMCDGQFYNLISLALFRSLLHFFCHLSMLGKVRLQEMVKYNLRWKLWKHFAALREQTIQCNAFGI